MQKYILVATYNVKTLYQTGKFHQLPTGSEKVNLDFIAIQEHRWTTEEVEYKWHSDGKYLLAYGLTTDGRQGGVGLLIHCKHLGALKSVKSITSGILMAKFHSEVTIVSTYNPIEEATDDDKNHFY